MIKEAIDRVLALSPITTINEGGRIYARDKEGTIRELIKSDHVPPTPLQFSFLPGLVAYCHANPDGLVMDELMVSVWNYGHVELFSPPNPANCNKRFCYAAANYAGGRFDFNKWLDQELFIIGLQTRFVDTANLRALRQLVAKLDDITETQMADDGMGQRITMKTGVTTVDKIEIDNPIELQPWATFKDAKQPLGLFVLRMRTTSTGVQLNLFEADSESWKVQAVANIRDYLSQELPDGLVVLA